MEEPLPDWDTQDFYETDSYNEELNMRFLMRSTINRTDNTVFVVMLPVINNVTENFRFEEAMTRCVEIFDTKEQDSDIMKSFTKLLSEFYDCELAYIYSFDGGSTEADLLAHWIEPDFVPNEGTNHKIGLSSILHWFKQDNSPTIMMADRENQDEEIHPSMLEILDTFQVKNVAFCKVENGKGNFVGMVGLTNRRNCNKLFDRRLITTIARFVAQDVANGVADKTLFNLQNRDTLTGVYNREGYALWIKQVWEDKPKTLGVISVNINGLKSINENAGICGGDAHIKTSVKQLKEHFDFEFFRMSGDEFLGIAPNIEQLEFNEKVTQLYDFMKTEENYDFAFGYAFGTGTIDLSKLTLESETVMYINKQEYYSSNKRRFDTVRDNILAELLSYLENDEFMIYLQPQVKLSDGSIYGAEALIRRFDKTNNKMVFPDQFIPLYEQRSIIRHVDIFVIETVCKKLASWQESNKALPISVNLSRVTLLEYGIVDTIVEICDKYNIPHNLLVIEVTERVGLIENNVASALITAFKTNGFHISLDDFGCAYSNIVTLAQIEVDEVKIDKSLVDDLTTNNKNHILVKNVLAMCNELEGTTTLAEGIEYEEQATLLHKLGCTLGQGYFYSRPIPVDEFESKYIEI